MNNVGQPSKKPTLSEFQEIASKTGGTISAMASHFGVIRKTIYVWCKEDADFQAVIDDERGKILDECIYTSRVLSRGIPIKEKDENGKETSRIVGWIERPDSGMIKYLMSTLGRNEGFGESLDVKAEVTTKGSIDINSWLTMNNTKKAE